MLEEHAAGLNSQAHRSSMGRDTKAQAAARLNYLRSICAWISARSFQRPTMLENRSARFVLGKTLETRQTVRYKLRLPEFALALRLRLGSGSCQSVRAQNLGNEGRSRMKELGVAKLQRRDTSDRLFFAPSS